jgi:hypothetical protein
MQKVINVLAVLSFLGTASIIGGGSYVYLKRDAIVEDVKAKITAAVSQTITDALPGLVDSAVPELPKATGPALPF